VTHARVFRPRGGTEKVLVTLLARERAPGNAHRDMYVNTTGLSLTGALFRLLVHDILHILDFSSTVFIHAHRL